MQLSVNGSHQIHQPAAADVRPAASKVAQDIVGVAPRILKGIGQDRHPVESTVGVDTFGKGNDSRREPRRIDDQGAERVTEDIAQ
jgi:hypothetical protein